MKLNFDHYKNLIRLNLSFNNLRIHLNHQNLLRIHFNFDNYLQYSTVTKN